MAFIIFILYIETYHFSTSNLLGWFIDFEKFISFINLLHYYNELNEIYKKLDVDDDRRISFSAFKKGYKLIGINVGSEKELKEKFDEIDASHRIYSL